MKKILSLGLLFIMMMFGSCSQVELNNSKNDKSESILSQKDVPLKSVVPGKGTLEIHLYQTVIENGQVKYYPLTDAGVYIDDHSPFGGPSDGITNDLGVCSLELSTGLHTVTFFKTTSSHSYFVKTFGYSINIQEGLKTELYVGYAILEATVNAYGDAGWGNAYYITGQTDELGNWSKAYKMTYTGDKWSFNGYIAKFAEFKIIKAQWVDGNSITIENTNVQWEQGYNHVIQNAGLYSQPNNVYPIF